MFTINKNYLNKINILNLFISIIPLSLILGNLATNINIILICVLGIVVYGKKVFQINQKIYQVLIYLFFIYLILITFINNWDLLKINEIYKINLYKSFFYLRFLILFLIITKLIDDNQFRTDFLFISCAFFSFLVSIDIIIQIVLKKNMIGIELYQGERASSFFGNELIAGGYIQKFSLFFIFFFAIKFKEKIKSNFLIILFFFLFLIPIIFTLNRMPLIIFLLSIFFYFIIEKKIKEISLIIILPVITIGILSIYSSKYTVTDKFMDSFKNLQIETKDIIINVKDLFLNNELTSKSFETAGYIIHFNSGVQIWKKNKILGHGLKSFRLNCSYEKNQTCNTHPHNYFIELMVDTGVIGLTIIYAIFIIGILNFLKYYSNEKIINCKLTSSVFFLLIFFEFFPFRTSGSFFTTNNSTFIFLILAIFLNIKKLKKL